MAEYLVLARKYRSGDFDEVVGQQAISTTLKNAISTGRIAQAYLFTGTRGVGKTTMARILAKALNCLSSDSPTASPCNKCQACVSIARGDDMDVVEIDGASNRGIEEIRELIDNASLVPSRCRYRVFYIDEVHMLTREAFNALLKTLEEPPAHVKFIFATTEPNKIPATILSRCQRFDFRNISTADIAGHMEYICKSEGIDIESSAIFRVARAAAGSMRDGLSLLDQLISSSGTNALRESDVLEVLGCPDDERIFNIISAIAASDPAAALTALDDVLASGFTPEAAAAALAEQFRFIMLILVCGPDSPLVELPAETRKQLSDLASKNFTVPAAVQAVSMCEQLMRNLRTSVGARALAEAMLVRLAAADKFVDVESLTKRLQQLAASGGVAAAPSYAAKKKALNVAPATDSRMNRPAGRPTPPPADRNAQPPQSPGAAEEAKPAQSPLAAQVQWHAQWFSENWKAIIAAVGGSDAGMLAMSKPAQVSPGQLTLAVPPQQLKRIGDQWSRRLGAAMARVFNCQVQLNFIAGEQTNTRRHSSVSSEDYQRVANDPAIKTVMELFEASIEKIVLTQPEPDKDSSPDSDVDDAVEDDFDYDDDQQDEE